MRVEEALVIPLGMRPEYFAYARGVAGAILGGQGDAGRQAPSCPSPAQPPPRPTPLAGAAGHPLQAPPLGPGLGGRTTGSDGRRFEAWRAPRPARRAGGWLAARHARPAPRPPPRWLVRCLYSSAQGPAAAAGGRREAGGGCSGWPQWKAGAGRGARALGGPLRLACAASAPPRWQSPGPHLYVEQRY